MFTIETSPSPAGRSPQRGTGTARPKDEKVGEGVNNINEHLNRSDVYKSIGTTTETLKKQQQNPIHK